MEANNTTGGSLPSFQTFLFGHNRNTAGSGYNGFAPSGIEHSGLENPYEYKPQVNEQYQSGNTDKQSLYYKECLPSFSNFVNFPPLANEGNPLTKTESHNYEQFQATSGYYPDNYYSSKLNEISQKGHEVFGNHVKSEPESDNYSRGTCLLENASKGHRQYPGYNSQYMNCMPSSDMPSLPNLQHFNETSSMQQQYEMLNEIKSENMYGSSNGLYQDHNQTHNYLGQDESSFADVDSILLKRKKPADSKRAKKLKGGIDCNYELCNMWHELADPTDASAGRYISEKSLSSFSSDSESQTELVSKPDGEAEHLLSNDSPCSTDKKSTITKPVTIFNYVLDDSIQPTCRKFLEAERKLCQHLKMISFGEPVSHIYNPLVYAFETHLKFLKTFCNSDKSVLFLAMNPGPFGMSQNGVPFGEVSAVRDWFQIRGNVQKPAREHPKRCITGLDCQRSEVSGSRFWGFFRKICGTPEVFFQHCFVHNFCPLAFMSPTGRNITPPELKADQRNALNHACEMALIETLQILHVKIIVCVGKFVESRVQSLLKSQGNNEIRVERITHPSPINPAANKGWDDMVHQQLKDIGIMSYFNRSE